MLKYLSSAEISRAIDMIIIILSFKETATMMVNMHFQKMQLAFLIASQTALPVLHKKTSLLVAMKSYLT